MTRHLVTGASGFIGTHVMRRAASWSLDLRPPAEAFADFFTVDIRDRGALQTLHNHFQPAAILHLAALGEVLIPLTDLGLLYETNVVGTYHLATVFNPRVFVFASSSSVYGDADAPGAAPTWTNVHPLGNYGMTKAAGELVLRDWTEATPGVSAINLRIGNVIGEGCRGLIRYLVDHALADPEAKTPAQLRGGGKLLRDYVPVDFVADAFLAAAARRWNPGVETLNLSTGRALSNRDVLDIVQAELRTHGFALRVTWSDTPALGEATCVILDPAKTEDLLGLQRPSPDAVISSIQQAVHSAIAAHQGAHPCAS